MTIDPIRGPLCAGCPVRVPPCHADPAWDCARVKAHHGRLPDPGPAAAPAGPAPCCTDPATAFARALGPPP